MLTDDRLARIRERVDVLLSGDIKDDVEDLLAEIDRLRTLLEVPPLTVTHNAKRISIDITPFGMDPNDA